MPDHPGFDAHTLRDSPLAETHVQSGAVFTEFSSWRMPLRYSSQIGEHHAVRKAAGMFDISHMAQFLVSGPQRNAFLDYALALDASTLRLARARYTMILAPDGGIIDDLIVTRIDEERLLVVANAGNRDVVRVALGERSAGFDVSVRESTNALIAVQGPRAREVLEAASGLGPDPDRSSGAPLGALAYYAATWMLFAGRPVVVSRTGYTGEDGFELSVGAADAGALWQALVHAGAPLGLALCGLAARDTLRLEAGMPLYGHELSREVQPAQAGLGRAVPLATKRAGFVGRRGVEAGPPDGAPVLVGLESPGRRAGRAGYRVLQGGSPIGTVTSGALSPTLGHPIAMAYVTGDLREPGTSLSLDVRGTEVPARVTELPFYRRKR